MMSPAGGHSEKVQVALNIVCIISKCHSTLIFQYYLPRAKIPPTVLSLSSSSRRYPVALQSYRTNNSADVSAYKPETFR